MPIPLFSCAEFLYANMHTSESFQLRIQELFYIFRRLKNVNNHEKSYLDLLPKSLNNSVQGSTPDRFIGSWSRNILNMVIWKYNLKVVMTMLFVCSCQSSRTLFSDMYKTSSHGRSCVFPILASLACSVRWLHSFQDPSLPKERVYPTLLLCPKSVEARRNRFGEKFRGSANPVAASINYSPSSLPIVNKLYLSKLRCLVLDYSSILSLV
jgi:hypothetical protein